MRFAIAEIIAALLHADRLANGRPPVRTAIADHPLEYRQPRHLSDLRTYRFGPCPSDPTPPPGYCGCGPPAVQPRVRRTKAMIVPFTCSGCDNTWTGASRSHCSGCHRTFSGLAAFDAHRYAGSQTKPGGCIDPALLVRAHRDGTPATPLLRLADGIWRSADERPTDTLPGQPVS